MRSSVILCALLIAPALAQTTEHSVLFSGKVSGSQTTTTVKNGELHVVFTYRDNGRGPDIDEIIRVDADGTIASYRVKGKSTFGAPIVERFQRRGSRATWDSNVDRGETNVDGPALYLPIESSLEPLAIAVRALLKQPNQRMKALPAGELSVQKIEESTFENNGERRTVALYALQGINTHPTFVWLTSDAQQDLFAFIYPGYMQVVASGWEDIAAELEQQQVAAEAQMLRDLNKRLRHELPEPILIRNVNVFDSENARMTGPHDVYVNRGRIAAVYPPSSTPREARTIIDGTGRSLVPALFDMHTHESAWSLVLQMAGGVTTSRDMGNDNALLTKLRDEIDRGEILGPRIIPAGYIEGESPFASRGGFVARNLDDVKEAIDWYAQHGYRQIKIYNSFKPEWVKPAAQYAHERGLRVSGHVPAFMKAEDAVRAGFDEIQHINQVMLNFFVKPDTDTRTLARFYLIADNAHDLDLKSKRVTDLIDLLRERGTTVDVTIATFEAMMKQKQGEMNPSFGMVADHVPVSLQRYWKKNSMDVSAKNAPKYRASFTSMLGMIKAMHDAGIPIVAGTDEIAGFTLHRELELYVEAGIPAGEALRIATWNGAKYTGTLPELGSVSAHKLADVILVEGDPVADISDIRKISMVMKGGAAYYPAEIYEAIGVRRFTEPPRLESHE